MLKQV